MKNLLIVSVLITLLTACFHRRPSAAELQHKIDSVQTLEAAEHLRRQGINLEEVSPLQVFFDSLAIQTLPISYSEDYMKLLPNYEVVPVSIMSFLELEGRVAPKAVALPETLGMRLMLLAADVEDGEYELWLYSLDNDYFPVDKLLLYEPQKFSSSKLKMDPQETYFSITSDYEVRIVEYIDETDRVGQLSTFLVDASRQFVEKRPDESPL